MPQPISFKSFSSYLPSLSSFKTGTALIVLKGGILAGYIVSYCIYSAGRPMFQNVGSAVAEKNPLPILLTGMLGVAIVESIGLTYEIGKRILGERSFFKQITSDDIDILTPLDRYRYRAWKVVSWLEQRVELIDIAYSRFFGIHTQAEIKAQKISQQRWDLMEIVRAAFKEQAKEMLEEPYPESGYTMLLLNFVLGATDKINQISHKIQMAKLEEKRRKKSGEPKAWCTILDAWASNYEKTHSFDLPIYDMSKSENNKAESQTELTNG